MKKLLFEEKTVSFNSLSEQFMVSKTSIKKDFEYVVKELGRSTAIQLVSDTKGTRMIGNETALQKAFLEFNRYVMKNTAVYSEELFSEKTRVLQLYYGEKIVSVCTNILYSYVRENVNAISDNYVQNVLNSFIILMYRLKKNRHIEENELNTEKNTNLFFKESAVKMLHKASLRLEASYTPEDVDYFSQHLISNRFELLPEEEIDTHIIDQLLFKVSEALSIEFSKDEKLEEQLRQHIPPMIYRLKTNNKIENPFTSQIKAEFSLTFNVIWVVLSEYEKELKISFNEDEIAFLTIYFQAAIERAKINRKILIVCQMGVATSELLINRIKNVNPSLDTFEVASVPELEHLDLEAFDLIISTIKIELPGKKVLVISPFLTEKELASLPQLENKPNNLVGHKTKKKRHHLEAVLHPEFMYLNTDFHSKEELISTIGKALIEKGYIQEAFVESALERERLGGTDLPSATAVPHGNSLYVNQTIVAVVKNKKKFKWNQYYVDLIFLICISKEDTAKTRNILSDIYNSIDNPQQLKRIRAVSSKKNLYIQLGSEDL